MNKKNDIKCEVEKLMKRKIDSVEFDEALENAKVKQKYIYENTGRGVVLQPWYLAKLTEEYIKSNALSKFTMKLCRVRNMEKEHQFKRTSTPQAFIL